MSSKQTTCTRCEVCDKYECKVRIPEESFRTHLRSLAFPIVIGFGVADIFTILALYYFKMGSHQQDNSWNAAWDAYYCNIMIFPASILVAICSISIIIGLFIWCFVQNED